MNIKKILFVLIIALAISSSFSIVSAGLFDFGSSEPQVTYLDGNIISSYDDCVITRTLQAGTPITLNNDGSISSDSDNSNVELKGNVSAKIDISSLTEEQKGFLKETFEKENQPDVLSVSFKEGDNETITDSFPELISYSIDGDILTMNLTVSEDLDSSQSHDISKIDLSEISFDFNGSGTIFEFTAKNQ